MFGSVPFLVDAVQPLLGLDGPIWILLNLRGVRRLDYSGAIDLLALSRTAASKQCDLIVTELQSVVLDALTQTGVTLVELPILKPQSLQMPSMSGL